MGLNHKVIFGMKLRQFREQAGLSLTDLGARIRLSTSYLTEIEHGKKYPKAKRSRVWLKRSDATTMTSFRSGWTNSSVRFRIFSARRRCTIFRFTCSAFHPLKSSS